MYQESIRAFLKPVVAYLDDPTVSEIMINGPDDVWIEAKGKLTKTEAKFVDEEALQAAARNMAQYVGRMINTERPRLDARLPDGSRIHIVIPPIARKGTTISIRKFFSSKLGIDKLIEFGSMTPQMARFIEACVIVKENIIVAGGTGSGKTTLLNIVSTLIPADERILTIEDSAELQLQQDHIVPFESRPPDKLGKGAVTMGDLLTSALRLRPDRIVVGEVRGGEAFDLLQAMNTGHGGSMATTHANTPTDTLRRLESLCLMSGVDLPMVAVRAQVASAINVVICCERFQDGSRRTTHIAEVLPLNEKGDYRTQDLFVYTPVRKDENGKIIGYHAPTGILPTFLGRCHAYGFADLTEEFFDPATYGVPPPPIFNHAEGVKTRWAKSLRHREDGHADPENLAKPSDLKEPPKNVPLAVPLAAGIAGEKPPEKPAEKPADKPVAKAAPAPAPAPKPAPKAEAESSTDVQPVPRTEEPPARRPLVTPAKAAPAPAKKPADPEPDDALDEEFERQMEEAIAAAAAADEAERARAEAAKRPAGSGSGARQQLRPSVPPPKAPAPSPLEDVHSNIQIAPDLKAEADALMPLESTLKHKGSLVKRPGAPARREPADDDDLEPEAPEGSGEKTMIRPIPTRRG